jgi:hypothetical protein
MMNGVKLARPSSIRKKKRLVKNKALLIFVAKAGFARSHQ